MASEILSYAGHPNYQRVSTLLVAASDFVLHPHHRVIYRSTTRSFRGMMPLSVMLMCSGQISVQHPVMFSHAGTERLSDLWDTTG
tara:strand:+ start:8370 stop:8624 length:255 start_codon:yes stop_codon:yes gene_type:complete